MGWCKFGRCCANFEQPGGVVRISKCCANFKVLCEFRTNLEKLSSEGHIFLISAPNCTRNQLSFKSSNEAYAQALHSLNHSLRSLPRQWMTCSDMQANTQMLEDDVRAATQQIWLPDRHPEATWKESSKLPDLPRPSGRRQEEQSHPKLPLLMPLSISYEKLLPMIQDLSDFRWPGLIRIDPAKRDHSKKCAYHKERCRSLHYLVERLIKAGHLKQYLRSEARVRDTPRNSDPRTSKTPIALKPSLTTFMEDH
ncbi:hypothetical protein CK203_059989 [Vitis vinifera]|uniref:Uncharacterized protein n=1 Tax=Vitis vinifera TaxID=29760 RepID=A0A438GFE1_VITVI|nr:hypothetical protein CK203_059989 [Vitis vinifera]